MQQETSGSLIEVLAGKRRLHEIVNMLIAMKQNTADRVREESVDEYSTKADPLFSHETLDVYKMALHFTGWIESVSPLFPNSSDHLSKLDRTSTSIVLNIVEGNGRFTRTDQARFLGIAHRAATQSASILDLIGTRSVLARNQAEEGKEMLVRIAAMIASLSKRVNPSPDSQSPTLCRAPLVPYS